jgi:hypothetical protein
MKSLPVQSNPVQLQGGTSVSRALKVETKGVTFAAQRVELVKERWEVHNDARTDDARNGRVDQSCGTAKIRK